MGHIMDENKSKALAAALSQIEKQFGKGSIMRLGEADVGTGDVGALLGLDRGEEVGKEGGHRRTPTSFFSFSFSANSRSASACMRSASSAAAITISAL